MRSLFTLAIVCTLVLTAGAQGQSPAPGPEHKRLEVFVGNWTFQGEAKAAPGQPVQAMQSRCRVPLAPGNTAFTVTCEVSTDGKTWSPSFEGRWAKSR